MSDFLNTAKEFALDMAPVTGSIRAVEEARKNPTTWNKFVAGSSIAGDIFIPLKLLSYGTKALRLVTGTTKFAKNLDHVDKTAKATGKAYNTVVDSEKALKSVKAPKSASLVGSSTQDYINFNKRNFRQAHYNDAVSNYNRMNSELNSQIRNVQKQGEKLRQLEEYQKADKVPTILTGTLGYAGTKAATNVVVPVLANQRNDRFSKNKKGGTIHIKKENKGKFTDYCGGKVTDECIARAKKSGNKKLVKRATFAQNARKWKHQSGGQIKMYKDGDEITMPELVVMPRGTYKSYTGEESVQPSLQEYIDSATEKRRIEALNKMIKLDAPVKPKVPNQNIVSRILGRLGMSDKKRVQMFGYEEKPQTCITTVTSMYGDNPAFGNVTFSKDPEKFGFQPITKDEMKEGDLMQFAYKGIPHHSTMVTGFNEKGLPALTYSNGHYEPYEVVDGDTIKTIKHDNDNWSTNPDDETSLYNIGDGVRIFRYVGTDKDKKKAEKEYTKKYNKKPESR